MTKAVIIYGGNSRKSRLKAVQEKAENILISNGFITETIYIHELPAEDLIQANFKSPYIMQSNAKVEEAEVIVVVTPIYKAAYSGILKTYLDMLPQKGLEGKTVLPLVLGGSFGHLLVIDYGLKPVLSALGATTILKGVFVLDTQVTSTINQQFLIDFEAEERLNHALELVSMDNNKVTR